MIVLCWKETRYIHLCTLDITLRDQAGYTIGT